MGWVSKVLDGRTYFILECGAYTLTIEQWTHDNGFKDDWYVLGLEQVTTIPAINTPCEAMAQANAMLKAELLYLANRL